MKFLCVPCDTPMKLQTVGSPEGGSLSVVYSCPECGYEMAMLTNPYETQLVQSLGVRIGPDPLRAAEAPAEARARPAGASAKAGCPFAAMIPAVEGALHGSGARSAPDGAERGEGGPASDGAGGSGRLRAEGASASLAEASAEAGGANPPGLDWTAAAEARLEKVPSFVRPMARTGIEKFARERGALEVDEKILDAAREFFGM
jgi:hypothetical protein